MNDLNSRVAYLKGLAEGLGLDEEKRESKLFRAIIDVLAEMAEAIGRLRDDYDDLTDYAEAIDQDLNDLEDDFYDDGEPEEYYDDREDDEMFSVECPECHEIVYIDDDMLDDDDVVEILCPNCEHVVFVNDNEDFEDLGEYKAEEKENGEI